MAAINVNQNLTTNYGDPVSVPSGVTKIEVWGVDSASTPTAMAAVWVEISDGTTVAPVLTSTTSTYQRELTNVSRNAKPWTVRMKAVTGTPVGVIAFS